VIRFMCIGIIALFLFPAIAVGDEQLELTGLVLGYDSGDRTTLRAEILRADYFRNQIGVYCKLYKVLYLKNIDSPDFNTRHSLWQFLTCGVSYMPYYHYSSNYNEWGDVSFSVKLFLEAALIQTVEADFFDRTRSFPSVITPGIDISFFRGPLGLGLQFQVGYRFQTGDWNSPNNWPQLDDGSGLSIDGPFVSLNFNLLRSMEADGPAKFLFSKKSQKKKQPVYNQTEYESSEVINLLDDVDINIPIGKDKNRDAIAVVIGNRDYTNVDIPRAEFAINDAAVMKKYLIKTFGYDEDNIIYLANADISDFMSVFGSENDYRGKLYDYIKPNQSEVFIYYSGHGAPNIETGSSYFLPVNCDPLRISLTGYSVETFYKNISQLPAAKLIIVLDACFSGASQDGSIIAGASPIYIDFSVSQSLLKNGMVFAATRGNQLASWYPETNHSMFTYFFLKGLGGGADFNHDNKITVSEFEDYLCSKSDGIPALARRKWGREQTPLITAFDKTEILVELK
jgi:Caspase domain